MEVLSFDIGGKFAHFRKYYANNTALSFSIPPRTSLIGLIASALGKPKDSYYESLKSDQLRIGIVILHPIKKSMHRLNHLMVKTREDFTGRSGHIQTPFEVVSGLDIGKGEVCYRVYLSPTEIGKDCYEEIKQCFIKRSFHYTLTLGTANFLAHVSNVKIHSDVSSQFSNELLPFHSAVNADQVEEVKFELKDENWFIEEELMPADFIQNGDRELSKMNRMLFSLNSKPIIVRTTGEFYEFQENGNIQRIQFME